MNEFYPYEKINDTDCKGVIDKWVQYRIYARDLYTGNPVAYLLDFMKVGDLWITDIYPEIWADEEDRCRRLTSKEDIHINFERLSTTSVKVFLTDFNDDGTVMVISGSYQEEEDRNKESRRMRLYRYFFGRLKRSLGFDIIEIPGGNAFFISHQGAPVSKTSLIRKYKEFKTSR